MYIYSITLHTNAAGHTLIVASVLQPLSEINIYIHTYIHVYVHESSCIYIYIYTITLHKKAAGHTLIVVSVPALTTIRPSRDTAIASARDRCAPLTTDVTTAPVVPPPVLWKRPPPVLFATGVVVPPPVLWGCPPVVLLAVERSPPPVLWGWPPPVSWLSSLAVARRRVSSSQFAVAAKRARPRPKASAVASEPRGTQPLLKQGGWGAYE